jgi:hypothetical protein
VRATLLLLGLLLALCLSLVLSTLYHRWQRLHVRERFLLGMKQVSTPDLMSAEELSQLKLLRAPWWAVSWWLRDLWHGRAQPVLMAAAAESGPMASKPEPPGPKPVVVKAGLPVPKAKVAKAELPVSSRRQRLQRG